MDAEFEDDDTYGGDQLIPGAARSNLRNAGAKDDASIVIMIVYVGYCTWGFRSISYSCSFYCTSKVTSITRINLPWNLNFSFKKELILFLFLGFEELEKFNFKLKEFWSEPDQFKPVWQRMREQNKRNN